MHCLMSRMHFAALGGNVFCTLDLTGLYNVKYKHSPPHLALMSSTGWSCYLDNLMVCTSSEQVELEHQAFRALKQELVRSVTWAHLDFNADGLHPCSSCFFWWPWSRPLTVSPWWKDCQTSGICQQDLLTLSAKLSNASFGLSFSEMGNLLNFTDKTTSLFRKNPVWEAIKDRKTEGLKKGN